MSTFAHFTISPPEAIPHGMGYIEFIKSSYEVHTNQNKVKLRIRRRGSFGREKKVEIFTRDREAEEGRDYFCDSNNAGLMRFGPTEFYKGTEKV